MALIYQPVTLHPPCKKGTLDVSLLYVHRGFVTVEGVDGDDHLGGTRMFSFCGVCIHGWFPAFLNVALCVYGCGI